MDKHEHTYDALVSEAQASKKQTTNKYKLAILSR